MLGQSESSRIQAAILENPAVLLLLSFSIWLVLALRSPEISALVISETGKLLQSPAVRAHLDTLLAFRYQQGNVDVFSQRLIAYENIPVDFNSKSLSLGGKVKYFLVASALDISVIIPTWNEEKYLTRCLRSLTQQSGRKPLELIVVDGGSTDGTLALAEKYADKVSIEEGQTVGAARNKGAELATGHILAFIDADSVASEKWLEEIDRTLATNPRAVGVTGPTLPDEGTRTDELAYRIATGWAQSLSLRLGLPHVAGFNCAYRRDAFWQAGGFDEHRELSEDITLSMRIRHQGLIVFDPEMLAYTSLRRIKKYGYPYLTTYYMMNWATMLLFNRTLAYPKVR
jgi:hypothetical protein